MKLSRENKLLMFLCFLFVLLALLIKVPVTNVLEHNESTVCNVLLADGFGTGSFINNASYPYIITCMHVVESTGKKDINRCDIKIGSCQKVEMFSAKLVCFSKKNDFAILEIDKLPEKTNLMRFAKNCNDPLGSKLFFFGMPGRPGLAFLHTCILIKKKETSFNNNGFEYIGANIIQGTSGSVIFNEAGLGVGILCRGKACYEGPMGLGANIGMFTKIDDIRACINKSNLTALDGILDGRCGLKLSDLHDGPIELQ